MPDERDDMIAVEGLTRAFDGPGGEPVTAVDGITLAVPRGQTVALLGPNGAGKTTLMRMLSTLLPPTSGRAVVSGADVTREPSRVRSQLGYVGQGNSAGHNQRGVDEVVTQARIHGADRSTAKARAAELFATFGLEGLERRRTQEMSGGQRRRLDLAMGLVHHPALLFLDEPTTGLDPQNRANLWEHMGRIRRESDMTVVLTTHYLDEADAMAERIVVVDHGRILADGTAKQLKETHVGSRVILHTVASDARRLAASLESLPQVRAAETTGGSPAVTLTVSDSSAALPPLLAHAAASGIVVDRAEAREATLDDVFLTLTGRSLRDISDDTQEPS